MSPGLRPIRTTLLTLAIVLGIEPTTVHVQAHDEDPKSRAMMPPVHGPAFHRGQSQGGIAGQIFASDGIRLESWLPPNITSPGGANGNDCWGYTSPSGREYALMGHQDGLAIVEVTIPNQATVIDFIPGPESIWRDVKTYGTHAYIVTEGGQGVQVIDLSEVDQGVIDLVNTFGDGAAHNVVIDEKSGLLARAGNGKGLIIHDLKIDPVNPEILSIWPSAYVHDAQIHTFTKGPNVGRTVAFCCGGFNGGFVDPQLFIVDLSDPKNPIERSSIAYPFAGYSHQGWLADDERHFYLDDEFDETSNGLGTGMHIFDINDLDEPEWIRRSTNGSSAISHNLYTRDGMIYAANYTSGLRIFDATNPRDPVETAWFDTFPDGDQGSYSGLWSVYCGFASRTIIASDMQRGLFVLSIGEPTPDIEFIDDPTFIEPTGDSIRVRFITSEGVGLQSDSVRARILDSTMEAPVIIPLQHVKADVYLLNTPELACGKTTLRFEATSAEDTEFMIPAIGPLDVWSAFGWQVLIEDPMNDETNWTVGWNDDNTTSHRWALTTPSGASTEPAQDHTPGVGGTCWVTSPGDPDTPPEEHDLEGSTSLVSRPFHMADFDRPQLQAALWFQTSGFGLEPDQLRVEASEDDGENWILIESILTSSTDWTNHTWPLDELELQGDTLRIRFQAIDAGRDTTVEAAIDDVRIQSLFCARPIVGDLNGDGLVNGADMGILFVAWGPSSPGNLADIDGNGLVDSADLGQLLIHWNG